MNPSDISLSTSSLSLTEATKEISEVIRCNMMITPICSIVGGAYLRLAKSREVLACCCCRNDHSAGEHETNAPSE